MEKVYTRTKGIQPDMVDGFCPGCMHSTLFKLIGEVLEEMDMLDKCTCAIGVGCCGLGMGYFTYDYLLAAHGRACAVVCTWIISPTIPPPRPMAAPAPWPPA